MSRMYGFCKIVENAPLVNFGNKRQGAFFNYVDGEGVRRVELVRQVTDSIRVGIENEGSSLIEEVKITNQSLVTWDDYWVDKETGYVVDPQIRKLNLQRNSLVYVNINTPREKLEVLNVEGNTKLTHLLVYEAPRLKEIILDNCTSLTHVALGLNRNIQVLSARGCGMSAGTMEQLLRDFRPVITANANERGVGIFRKQYNTLLDLRGNTVDWSNRKIASKIRLLLANNWVVRWDNNPPPEVIPIRLYRFFVESEMTVK